MRLDKVELLEAAAQVLKKSLPKLEGLSEYEKSEIFTVYSLLKYLSMEFKQDEACLSQKEEAFFMLAQNMNQILTTSNGDPKNSDLILNQPIMELLTSTLESNLSKEIKESISDQFIEYFNRSNQAELQMFKK